MKARPRHRSFHARRWGALAVCCALSVGAARASGDQPWKWDWGPDSGLGTRSLGGSGLERWLVVVAADPSASGILRRAMELARRGAGAGTIIRSKDCGVPGSNYYLWVSELSATRERAEQIRATVSRIEPGASVRSCVIEPNSLLAFGHPAIDASMALSPLNSVDWRDVDRVSVAMPSGTTGTLLLIRQFEFKPNDPVQGRRTRVYLIRPDGDRVLLSANCPGVEGSQGNKAVIVLTCRTHAIGAVSFHTTHAFNVQGAPLATVPNCRGAAINSKTTLTCQIETLDYSNKLVLQPQSIHIGAT